jgi:hypothetical protein
VLAALVQVEPATGMVSIGTLVCLWIVCNAQVYRRYFPEVQMRFTRCAESRGSLGLLMHSRLNKALVHIVHCQACMSGLCFGLCFCWLQVWHGGNGSQG